MKKIFVLLLCTFGLSQLAHAQKGGFGLDVGMGTPFLSQFGLTYQRNDTWGFSLSQNTLDLSVAGAGVKLSMPEIMVNYHPFKGSYFIGLGLGQEKLNITSGVAGVNAVALDVEAMTTVLKTGWKWGIGNGGFWFGMDLSYVLPSSPKTTITAPGVPTNDPAYIDAEDAAKKFGETAFINITFARIGYLF